MISLSDIDEDDTYLSNHLVTCPQKIRGMIDTHHPHPHLIVDFGCGHGVKALAIAHAYPSARVVGVDVTRAFEKVLPIAERFGGMPDNLSFRKIESGAPLAHIGTPDVVYSWSVLEHVPRHLLPTVLADMHASLNASGVVITQIAPLYFSPFGSHLREYCGDRWAHLLLSHAEFRAQVLAMQEGGGTGSNAWMFDRFEELNKITASELAGYFHAAGFAQVLDERRRVDFPIPGELTTTYPEEVLSTFELNFVHRR